MTSARPGGGWDEAPCGLADLSRDGTVLSANRTLLDWLGRTADDLVGTARFSELLSVGGRIYWETHLSPLLHVDGRVDEVALEVRSPHGRLPVLMTAVVRATADGDVVHVALSGAEHRSRYERELVAARRNAELSESRLRALQDVTAALSSAVGVDAVGRTLLDAAVGPLGAAAGTLWLAGADGQLAVAGTAGEAATDLPVAGAVRHERRPVEDAGRVVVPLHGSSLLRGVLSLAPRADPAADPLDREVLTAVAQQVGLALDRAELYEQSASVSHRLQQSLLAVDPPDDPRFAVATVYRPGVEMLEVGGDWYDAFLIDDGVLSFVVGDVVGRGLDAASAMGQLRSAVRAVAGPEVGPAALLSRLDRFVAQVEEAGMATLAYADVDLATGAVRYACAGHPPPVLVPADGPPRLLWDGRSTPLGAYLQPLPRAEATLELAPGDRLLLYTDGLIERRKRSLDEGLDRLTAAAGELAGLPLADAVQALTAALLQDEQGRDDVCVLLLEWTGARFARELSADLGALSAVRSELGTWLRACGVADDARRDLVLAASEAVANAAEHGARRAPDRQVGLDARVEPGDDGGAVVVVRVHDDGSWRATTASDERGRGLLIVGALVDDVRIDTLAGTTVVLRRRVQRRAS